MKLVNNIAIRTMVKSVLKNYEGKNFTPEEIDEPRQEFKQVNDKVIYSNVEKVKRLVKKMSDISGQ